MIVNKQRLSDNKTLALCSDYIHKNIIKNINEGIRNQETKYYGYLNVNKKKRTRPVDDRN